MHRAFDCSFKMARYRGRFQSKKQSARLNFFVKTFAAGQTVARERRGRTMNSESPVLTPAGELVTAAASNGDISFD